MTYKSKPRVNICISKSSKLFKYDPWGKKKTKNILHHDPVNTYVFFFIQLKPKFYEIIFTLSRVMHYGTLSGNFITFKK